jgi:crotonobetainyl-CoA:carnitine CoA-transferase CaiB-like acyl-CoA transferase
MQSVDHPVAGRVDLPGTGLRSQQFDLSYRGPAPTVGQHTGPVLRDLLGLDDDGLDALVAIGAIGTIATSR